MQGQLFRMLRELCGRTPGECKLEIMFRPNEEGERANDSRAFLEAYAQNPTLENGRVIAAHLQDVTTKRSGLGLLFLAKGRISGSSQALVISRFPAEQGVVAQEYADRLDVEFIERVFMKNATAYKSALYQTRMLAAGFEEGRAVDRQISGPRELSQYWIHDFLASELRTTGPLGSRRLGIALRVAVNATTDRLLKRELISATQLLRNQDGKVRSARSFLSRLGVPKRGLDAVERAFPRPELMDENFRFHVEEFDQHISHRMIVLDNGAMLMATDATFDTVFKSEPAAAENVVRYRTEGRVIDQRYRKRK